MKQQTPWRQSCDPIGAIIHCLRAWLTVNYIEQYSHKRQAVRSFVRSFALSFIYLHSFFVAVVVAVFRSVASSFVHLLVNVSVLALVLTLFRFTIKHIQHTYCVIIIIFERIKKLDE